MKHYPLKMVSMYFHVIRAPFHVMQEHPVHNLYCHKSFELIYFKSFSFCEHNILAQTLPCMQKILSNSIKLTEFE